MAQGNINFKKQEESFLEQFATQNSLWYPKIDVKQFVSNGFENTKNNDYFHPELGIILYDLHDENVLTF